MSDHVVVIEPMGFGGVCHYTYNLCEALAARGTHVALITSHDYELTELPRAFRLYPVLADSYRLETPEAPADAPPHRSAVSAIRARLGIRARLRAVRTLVRIVAIVLKEQAPVVHLQWPIGPHDWMYLAIMRLLMKRLVVVYTAHNVLPHERTPADFPRLLRLMRQTDQVILHSEENRAAFMALVGDVAPPTSVIPMGNFGLFPESANGSAQEARAAVGVPPRARVVLFFGNIRPYKGLADLIEAFRRIRDGAPDAWLVIAGYPMESFQPYANAIAEANLGGRTALHLRYHPITEVAKFFRAADVVALPYRSASQSAIAQLAFAFGKPVVATRVGGLPEIIEDGRTGLLVNPHDEQGLAEAIARLLADPLLRQSMGTRAGEIAASRHSWDRVAEATQEIYHKVRARSPRSAHAVT